MPPPTLNSEEPVIYDTQARCRGGWGYKGIAGPGGLLLIQLQTSAVFRHSDFIIKMLYLQK